MDVQSDPPGPRMPVSAPATRRAEAGSLVFSLCLALAGCARLPSDRAREAGFLNLFGHDAHDGWAQCGPGHFTLEDGIATSHGGMGLWWYTNRMFTNFVLRGEWRLAQPDADTGVFLRFPDPGNDPWNAVRQGHEMEIGDDPHGQEPAWRTGALYPFSPPTAVPTNAIGQWNAYEITCVGQTYSVSLNDRLVNQWTDPQARTTHGHVGLQNYSATTTSQHRRLRIMPLP